MPPVYLLFDIAGIQDILNPTRGSAEPSSLDPLKPLLEAHATVEVVPPGYLHSSLVLDSISFRCKHDIPES